MRKTRAIFAITALLLFSTAAMAADQPNVSALLQSSISSSMDKVFSDLQSWVLPWLSLFILLQFTWTNIHLLIDGHEWERIWAKFLGSLAWFSICFYIFKNGADFIKGIAAFLLEKGTGVSGVNFDASYPINIAVNAAASMLQALDGSQSILQSLNPFPSIMMGLVSVAILVVGAILAFKVFMIFIETKIVIALSPLSFALLGLNAFKDQGLAPFKYLVALAYRIMIIAAILTAMGSFSTAIVEAFKTLPASSDSSVWPPIWAAAIGYSLLGALAWASDSIAAMLASGSSNMSPGSAAAAATVAGAATAAAVAGGAGLIGGVADLAKTAGGAGQSMGDFIKSLSTDGGSVSNASGSGSRGEFTPVGTPPPPQPKPPEMSVADINAARMAARPELTGGSRELNGGPTPGIPQPSSTSSGKPSSQSASSAQPSSGSASSAGIGGASNGTDQKLDKLIDSMSKPAQKPGATDHLNTLNDHLQREGQNGVHVSMNTHSD